MVQELLELAEKYQVQDFQFVDEAIRPDCFSEMVEEMEQVRELDADIDMFCVGPYFE